MERGDVSGNKDGLGSYPGGGGGGCRRRFGVGLPARPPARPPPLTRSFEGRRGRVDPVWCARVQDLPQRARRRVPATAAAAAAAVADAAAAAGCNDGDAMTVCARIYTYERARYARRVRRLRALSRPFLIFFFIFINPPPAIP